MMRRILRYGSSVFLLGVVSFAATGCGMMGPQKYSEERMVIGTYVRVDVCRQDQRVDEVSAILADVWDRFAYIEEHMNAYDSASDIGRINEAQNAFQYIPEDVYYFIEQSIAYSKKTKGAFDITVRPMIRLWQTAEVDGRLPTAEQIAAARAHIGVDRIQMRKGEGGFLIACDGCEIDLGGIAKGYAVDEAVKILRGRGIDHFLIDAGGDMYASGKNCSGRPWRIGVRHPRLTDQLIDVIEIGDQAITTSGDYEQFFEINGEVFSHIINPFTGYPQNDIISATVIAPTATEADVLSTALMVWDQQGGLDFINDLDDDYSAMTVTAGAQGLKQHYSDTYAQREHFKVFDDYISK